MILSMAKDERFTENRSLAVTVNVYQLYCNSTSLLIKQ